LERLPGVRRADVSLDEARAEVEFDDTKISPDKLVAAIDRLGFRSTLLSVEAARESRPPTTGRGNAGSLRLAATASPPSRMMTQGMQSLLARSSPPLDLIPTFTKTDTEVLRLLEDGHVHLAFLSLHGVERAASPRRPTVARFLVGGRIPLALHIIVPKASPIQSPRELQGQPFGVLDVGGVGEQMTRLALQALGLPHQQGRALLMGEHMAPLKRGEIAALVAAVPLPSPLVAGLAREVDVRLLPLDAATITATLATDRTLHREVIPSGSYPGQDVAILSVAGIHADALLARADVSEADVHHVLETVLGHPSAMQQACPFAREFAGDNLVPRSGVLPSHPGAARYFRETGAPSDERSPG
jgi:TRAP transporter TAXI family solute receptor